MGFKSFSNGRVHASDVFHRLFYSCTDLRDSSLFYHPGYLIVTLSFVRWFVLQGPCGKRYARGSYRSHVPVRSNASLPSSNLPLLSLPLATRYCEDAVPCSNDLINFASCIVGRFFRARSNDFVCKKKRRRATKRNKAQQSLFPAIILRRVQRPLNKAISRGFIVPVLHEQRGPVITSENCWTCVFSSFTLPVVPFFRCLAKFAFKQVRSLFSFLSLISLDAI